MQKLFENWLSGSKLNVSESELKNGLIISSHRQEICLSIGGGNPTLYIMYSLC